MAPYYCNLASPYDLDNEALKYIDWDLDVKVFTDGEKRLLDVEEYERHKRQNELFGWLISSGWKRQDSIDWINNERIPFWMLMWKFSTNVISWAKESMLSKMLPFSCFLKNPLISAANFVIYYFCGDRNHQRFALKRRGPISLLHSKNFQKGVSLLLAFYQYLWSLCQLLGAITSLPDDAFKFLVHHRQLQKMFSSFE